MNEFYTTWWSDIASEAEYAYIPIGQEPVSLTIHDLHTEELLPWNQQQIREAKHNPNGYYTIDILEEGNYQFRLSRYPPESGLAINEEAKKIDPSPSRDGLPTGIGIEATTAVIKLNDETISKADIDPGQPHVVIEKELGKGQYKFSSTFLTADNTQYSVYYNIIEKL